MILGGVSGVGVGEGDDRLCRFPVGCGDECPLVLAKRRVDWQIPDPKDMTPEQFRGVRNLIESKVKELLTTIT